MSFRFICPHCHASIEPSAMEPSFSDHAELRVCPGCDAPVVLVLRNADQPAGAPLRGLEHRALAALDKREART